MVKNRYLCYNTHNYKELYKEMQYKHWINTLCLHALNDKAAVRGMCAGLEGRGACVASAGELISVSLTQHLGLPYCWWEQKMVEPLCWLGSFVKLNRQLQINVRQWKPIGGCSEQCYFKFPWTEDKNVRMSSERWDNHGTSVLQNTSQQWKGKRCGVCSRIKPMAQHMPNTCFPLPSQKN